MTVLYDVVGVRFKKAGKVYYFDPNQFDISENEFVIVETVRGIEYGKVVITKKQVDENDVVLPLKRLFALQMKTIVPLLKRTNMLQRSISSLSAKVVEHNLDMKLVDVEYTFDRNKIIFYFTADGRIDFRELVKDLAAILGQELN